MDQNFNNDFNNQTPNSDGWNNQTYQQNNNQQYNQPYQQDYTQQYNQPYQQDYTQQYNQPYQQDYTQQYNQSYQYTTPYMPESKAGKGMGIASLILGIVSIALFCCCYLSIPCSITGLILGIVSKVKKKENNGVAIAGIILSAIALVALAVFIIYIFATDSYDYSYSYYDYL